jgi:hypothetical protein
MRRIRLTNPTSIQIQFRRGAAVIQGTHRRVYRVLTPRFTSRAHWLSVERGASEYWESWYSTLNAVCRAISRCERRRSVRLTYASRPA